MSIDHLNQFWGYSSVVLSTPTLFCNHPYTPSPELSSSCKTETPHPLNTNSPFPSPPTLPPPPLYPPSTFCLYRFDYTGYLLEVESYSIGPFVTGFFHLAGCLQGSSALSHIQFPSFLRLNDSPPCTDIPSGLSTRLLTDTWIASTFWKQSCSQEASFFVSSFMKLVYVPSASESSGTAQTVH